MKTQNHNNLYLNPNLTKIPIGISLTRNLYEDPHRK